MCRYNVHNNDQLITELKHVQLMFRCFATHNSPWYTLCYWYASQVIAWNNSATLWQIRDSIIFGWRCNQVFTQTLDVLHTANMRYASVMSLNHHDQVPNSWRTCTGVGFRATVFSQRLPCSHKSSQLSDWQSAHGQHEICFYHEFKSTRLKAQLLVDMLYVRTFQVYTILAYAKSKKRPG